MEKNSNDLHTQIPIATPAEEDAAALKWTNKSKAFGFFTNYTKMPILAFLSLLPENKKSSDKMLPQVAMEPSPLITSDSKSYSLLSELVWPVVLRRSLSFCSCITWFLDLRRFDSFEAKSLDFRNTFFRSYLVNTRQNEAIFRWAYHSKSKIY